MNEIEMLYVMHFTTYMVAVYELIYGSTVLATFIVLMWHLILYYLLGGKPGQ